MRQDANGPKPMRPGRGGGLSPIGFVPGRPSARVDDAPTLSIIVPVKNEEALIARFVSRVTAVLSGTIPNGAWEILFIDDGSTDATFAAIMAANHADPRVRALSLSRNFGKEAALSAGLDHARGAAVVPMDVDLQDPPEVLVEMFTLWRAGAEVVCGIRSNRKSDGVAKRVSASLFYWVWNRVSHDRIIAHAGDFRLMDRKVVNAIRRMPERNRFMKGMFAWGGFRQATVEYTRVERVAGTSKFSYWKLWTLALDGITSSSTMPLRVWSYIGGSIALLALAFALYVTVRTLFFQSQVHGYPSIIVSIMFFGGIQLMSLGVLGEYVGRILVETKQRPVYIVRDALGVEGDF